MRSFLAQRQQEFLGILIFWLLFAAVTVSLQNRMQSVELHLSGSASRNSMTQVYWRSGSEHYSEEKSLIWRILTNERETSFRIPLHKEIVSLRIDPLMHKGKAVFTEMKLVQLRKEPIDLIPFFSTEQTTSLQQGSFAVVENSLHLTSTGTDPGFELRFERALQPLPIWPPIAISLLLASATCVLLNQNWLKKHKRAGLLLVTVPRSQPLIRPPHLENIPGTISEEKGVTERQFLHYTLELKKTQPNSIPSLLAEIKKHNPAAIVRFQYNRSGET